MNVNENVEKDSHMSSFIIQIIILGFYSVSPT